MLEFLKKLTAGWSAPNADNRDFKIGVGWFLFFLFIGIYAYTSAPTIAPYRDTGEMVCNVATLGIAHQPGYPLYVLLSKALTSLIFTGNLAYELNVFSAVCGAGALCALYFIISRFASIWVSFLVCALMGLNFTFHTVSTVQEMYALNILFAAILLYTAFSAFEKYSFKKKILLSYLLGLFMTNRMDILLISPALGVLLFEKVFTDLKTDFFKKFMICALFFTLGFSLYLYILARSNSNPMFDWSHPADIATFLAVITRKSYGSTLDLISKNYALGELFLPNIKYYAIHLFSNFSFSLFLIPFGLYWQYNRSKEKFFSILTLFIITGPFFLFLANMPPNPHSLAVVEPNYLVPDIAVLFFIAAGAVCLYERKTAIYIFLAGGILTASIAYSIFYNLPQSNRRWLFLAEDYAGDVFKNVPSGSTVVAKKDVQLFSLWYLQNVRHKRPDIKVIAQGLSGSAWYQDSYKIWNKGFILSNLNSGTDLDWEIVAKENRNNMFATMDVVLPANIPFMPRGMLNEIYPSRKFAEENRDLWNFFNLEWLGEPYNDFFSMDLGVSYVQAAANLSVYFNSHFKMDEGVRDMLRMSIAAAPKKPDPYLYLGFYYSSRGDWKNGKKYFKKSAEAYENLIKLAGEYRSLENATSGILKSASYAWLNYGVSLEKTGFSNQAETAYQKALLRDPKLAQAHFNMAILYWRKDANRVIKELKATLAIEPNHKQAAYYLKQFIKR